MFHVTSIQVFHFLGANVFNLSHRHFANFVKVGNARALGNACRLLQHRSRRRALGDKVKRSVVVNRNDNRNRRSVVLFRSVIKLLDKLPQVNAELTQRRTNRRRRSGLTTGHLELRFTCYLFRHGFN